MMKISFFIFSLVFCKSFQNPIDGNRIIGGRDADISEFPFIARSFYRGRAWCGNVIINEMSLISAAHCYDGGRIVSDYTILAGQTDIRNNQSAIQLAEIIFYPDYINFRNHDIAILKLTHLLPPWSQQVQPVRLPPPDYHPLTGTHLDVSGWGDLYYGAGAQSFTLQTVHLDAITNQECSNRWSGLTEGHICAKGDSGRNSCNGDSGGPLSIGPMVLGLVSYGDRCDSSGEKVFTRVSSYLDFIKQHT